MIIDLEKFREAIFNILSAEEYKLNMKLYDKNGFKIISPETSSWIFIEDKDYIVRFPDDSKENVYLYFWRNDKTADDADMLDIMNRCKNEAMKYGVIVQLKNFKYKNTKKEFPNMVNKGAIKESIEINHNCKNSEAEDAIKKYVKLCHTKNENGDDIWKGSINDSNYNFVKQCDNRLSELRKWLNAPENKKAPGDTAVRDAQFTFNQITSLLKKLSNSKSFEDFEELVKAGDKLIFMCEFINSKYKMNILKESKKNLTKFEEDYLEKLDSII